MADEEWKKRLNDPKYKNWIKVSLALIQSKEALHDFTKNVIDDLHRDIKTKVGPGTCTGTSACNRKGGKPPSCPSCDLWVKEIKLQNKGQLQWKNADPTKWDKDPWEIAKCFMNPQGSKASSAAVTGPDKTDLSGMLNVLINCKKFRNDHISDIKLAENVRTVRNELMHCATMSFNDADMKGMIDQAIALLEDGKELKGICQKTVKTVKSLRDNEFELKQTDEHECIKTALAAASGEGDLANGMRSKLCELIKGNKDLEMKFEGELNKLEGKLNKLGETVMSMKEESDAKFSTIDFNIGELKGQINNLTRMVTSGQSFSSNPTSSVIGNEIKSFYISMLESYAQKKNLAKPEYGCHPFENGFQGTVRFNGEVFKSNGAKPTKKEAKQCAAEEALNVLGNDGSEECDEKNESPSTKPQESTQQETRTKNFKGLLQEKAQKQRINKPIYVSKKTDDGLFLSEVMYNGVWYSPDKSLRQTKKIDAEQKAAEFALAALDSDMSTSQLDGARNAEPRNEVKPAKNVVKPFKVILNEHVQKTTKGIKLPNYQVDQIDGKFICTVTVFDELYKSPSGENSKQDAKESAAKEACKALDLVESTAENATRAGDLSSEKEEIPTIEPASDETDFATPQIGSTDIVLDATSDEGKACNAISKLNEYAQRKGVKLVYEDIPADDAGGFRCKVTVQDKTFECKGSYPSKKVSKQMAAKEAIEHLCGLYDDNTSATNSPAVPSLDSKKRVAESASTGSNTEEMSLGIAERTLEQTTGFEIAKPPSETTVSENPDRQQISTPKTQLNHKNALKEYVEKRKLGQAVYEQMPQDPTTKTFMSKVFIGRRCFKGKDPKTKLKEADKHVAQVALDILEGRSRTPEYNFEEVLKEYHNSIDSPTFPKYEEASCEDDGQFKIEVKVKKRYKFVCEDARQKKKDAEVWLAEQAVRALEKENKISPSEGNPKSRLNVFLQSQGCEYDIQGDLAKFTGSLCFYAVDVYESLAPQKTKKEAKIFAAMSACNGMDLI